MKKEAATLRDIALKMDMSISTVSRALRNMPDVNAETRNAVLELAEKMHYQPNIVAQSLRSNRTHTIGVIVPHIAFHFFSTAISGMQDMATDAGYNIIICQTNEQFELEKSHLRMLVGNRVDGIIISLSRTTLDYHHFDHLIESEIPTVFFDRVLDSDDFARVVVDDYKGAYKATEHLCEAGYKRIAQLAGPKNLRISHDRVKGYKDALQKYGLEIDDDLIVHCEMLEESAPSNMQQLLDRTSLPDAVVCFNDLIAISAIDYVKTRGISIPDELGFVGFSNVPVGNYMTPSLTTIHQPAYEMGRLATKLILSQIDEPDDFLQQQVVLNTELIVRDSSKRWG